MSIGSAGRPPTGRYSKRSDTVSPVSAWTTQAAVYRSRCGAGVHSGALACGETVADVAAWSDRIEAVAIEDVRKAVKWLDRRRAVTGFLLPQAAA